MVKRIALIFMAYAYLGSANAQAFKDFATDIAMKNLHNKLEQRRQLGDGSETSRYDVTTKTYASFILLNWMVANQTDDLPEDDYIDALRGQAQRALEGAGVYDNRNLEIDVMLFIQREFDALHEKWRATEGDRAAAQNLSDQTWQAFKTDYGIDLRTVSIDDLTH